ERGLGLVAIDVQREVEVQQHWLAVYAHEDVGRLDVAVQHPAVVCVLQAFRQPGHDPGADLHVPEPAPGRERTVDRLRRRFRAGWTWRRGEGRAADDA